jgi:hypothetical protein
VSILVSAVHAVRPLFPGREAIVAGLVHGMAFSFTLAELGLSTPVACVADSLGAQGVRIAAMLWIAALAVVIRRSESPLRPTDLASMSRAWPGL